MNIEKQFSPHYSTLPPEKTKEMIGRVSSLLENKELETLFRGSCCYQWALRINRDRLPKASVMLATYLSPGAKQTHAYLRLDDGRCVDVCKVFETESMLWEHWVKSKATCQTEFLALEWLEEEIRRRLPDHLNVAVMCSALVHFDTENIFKSVRNA